MGQDRLDMVNYIMLIIRFSGCVLQPMACLGKEYCFIVHLSRPFTADPR